MPKVAQQEKWNLSSDLSDAKTHVLKCLYCSASHLTHLRLCLFNLFNCSIRTQIHFIAMVQLVEDVFVRVELGAWYIVGAP